MLGSKRTTLSSYCSGGYMNLYLCWNFPGVAVVKNLPASEETQQNRIRSLGWEDLLEEEMATCSSILARKIPWTEKPDSLQSIGLQGVGHN